MRAIVYEKYGSTDFLELREIQKPHPKNNEVLIKLHATSVNSWDWDLVRGKPFLTRLASGALFTPKTTILGADVAGVVEATGPDVQQFKIGDGVVGFISGVGWGGFAEFVCVPEGSLVSIPPSMTFEQAAAIPQAGLLALQGMRDISQVKSTDRVLINGAGSGVGTFALQLAKLHGAEVTAVDSSPKLNMLRELGADHTIDYTTENFTENGKTYDLILDNVASRSLRECQRSLTKTGAYVVIGGATSTIFKTLLFGTAICGADQQMKVLMHSINQTDLNYMVDLCAIGKIASIIDQSYALAETAKAIQRLGDGLAKGKIVIHTDAHH